METNRDSRLGVRDSGENHSPTPHSPFPTPHSPLPIPDSRIPNPESRELFELAPEEIEVCLRLKGPGGLHQLLHYLRPPTFEDWREYERNLRSTVESVECDGEETLRFDSCALEAAATLYDRLFRRAHGYQAGDGGSTSLPTGSNGVSAERIPLHHKELVTRALSEVAPASPEASGDSWEAIPFSLDAETVEVRLEATRAGAKHLNLVHVFRPPAASDRVEHSRIHAQALYVRGSQTLKSLLPSRLPGLAALYDKLILEARGYAVAGRPLADRAALVRHMDPLHKKVAVQALFGE